MLSGLRRSRENVLPTAAKRNRRTLQVKVAMLKMVATQQDRWRRTRRWLAARIRWPLSSSRTASVSSSATATAAALLALILTTAALEKGLSTEVPSFWERDTPAGEKETSFFDDWGRDGEPVDKEQELRKKRPPDIWPRLNCLPRPKTPVRLTFANDVALAFVHISLLLIPMSSTFKHSSSMLFAPLLSHFRLFQSLE